MADKVFNCDPKTFENSIYVFKILDKRDVMRRIVDEIDEDGRSITLCDIGEVKSRYIFMKKIMPRVQPYYAVKCNNEPSILKTLATLGAGFDCASPDEIDAVRALQVPSERIIFANPTKPKQFIKHALNTNVQLMTFDCEQELYKIHELFKDAKLIIRIRNDANNTVYSLGNKFGCPIKDVYSILDTARIFKLNVVGVSFHVGSLCDETEAYARGIAHCRNIFDYGIKIGFNMHILDIGGGFHGTNKEMIEPFAKVINNSLTKYFPNKDTVTVISEPGRYLVESCYWTACNIHTKKIVDQHMHEIDKTVNNVIIRVTSEDCCTGNDRSELHAKNRNMRIYHINDGIYGLFNFLEHEELKVTPEGLKATRVPKMHQSIVYGPTCHSNDKLLHELLLPDLEAGEWLLFQNVGAYSMTLSTDFNSYPRSRIIRVLDKHYEKLLYYNELFSNYNIIQC